jgi:hypothetical protein
MGSDREELVQSREEFFYGDSTLIMSRRSHATLEQPYSGGEGSDEDDYDDEDGASLWSEEDYSDDSEIDDGYPGGLPGWAPSFVHGQPGPQQQTAFGYALAALEDVSSDRC